MVDMTTENRLGSGESAVSWAAIAAGGLAAAALTLVLLAFGAGIGLSSVSPWSNSGVSAGTFSTATGVFLAVSAMLSSTIGGYIAGRLRTKWPGLHSDEVTFRDTAHGLLAWALATVVGAAVLGGAATYVLGGAATGTAQGAAQSQGSTTSNDYFVDMLLRPTAQNTSQSASDPAASRREVGQIFAHGLAGGGDLTPADRDALARIVSARTGLPQAEAEKRLADVIAELKVAADKARGSLQRLRFG